VKTSTIISQLRNIADIAGTARDAKARNAETVHVGIFVDPTAPADCISWVKAAFTPERDTAFVHVELLENTRLVRVDKRISIAVIVVGTMGELAGDMASSFAQDSIPVAVVCESSVDAPDVTGRVPEGGMAALIIASSQAALEEDLGRWMVTAMPDSLTLAGCFPFIRAAKTGQLIGACAMTNAIVGALALPSAAQMPIMTLNQAKMAIDINSIHGIEELSQQAPAIVAVAGAGLVYRQVARMILKRFPKLGIIAKAGVAFAGTFVTGEALNSILNSEDKGQSLRDGFSSFVSGAVNEVMELSKSLKS